MSASSRAAALAAVCALLLAGCSEVGDKVDDAVDELTGSAAEAAVQSIVSDELQRVGVELEGPPECTADVERDGASLVGTVGCTATTTGGDAVTADFDGSLSTSGCEGTVLVKVGEETLVDGQAPDSCVLGS